MNRPEPDFDIDYGVGRQGELLVGDLLESLTAGGVEVKTDRDYVNTANIFVERECFYPNRGWRNTGISNPDTATKWAYVLRGSGAVVFFDRDVLRSLADSEIARYSECIRGGHPTRGVLLRMPEVFGKRGLAGGLS